MDGRTARKIAADLYESAVSGRYQHPKCYADLVAIVFESGAQVVSCQDAPRGFTGVQIGAVLYVNTSSYVPDWMRLRILAHEWCHWMRRRTHSQSREVRFYQGLDRLEEREGEEKIARAFEILF